MLSSSFKLMLAASAAVLLAACGGGGSEPAPGAIPPPVTVTDPVPVLDAALASCGVSSNFLAVGPTWQFETQNYAADGRTVVSRNTTRLSNTGAALFNGFNAVETIGRGTITLVAGGEISTDLKLYNSISGSEKIFYGFANNSAGSNGTISYSPPQRFSLVPAVGTTELFRATQKQELSLLGSAPVTNTSSLTISRNTVGIETITVPAGTLRVCRTDITSNSINAAGETSSISETQHTLATGACKGQVARQTDRASGRISFEMVRATVNGVSCV